MTEAEPTNQRDADMTTGDARIGSYRGIFHTAIPLGMEQLLQHIVTPIYLYIIMHMANPEIESGALFSYMTPVFTVISAPISSLNTLANVYAVHAANIIQLRRYAFILGSAASLLAVLFAFSPLGDLLFKTIMGVPEKEYRSTILAFQIAIPLPFLWSLRQLAMGVLIRTGHAWTVLTGRVIRVVLSVGIFLVASSISQLPGAPLGAACLVLGLLAQTGFLVFFAIAARHQLARKPIQKTSTNFRELARVGIPLTLTPLILSVVPFLLSASLGRLPGIVLSLATWPIVYSLSGLTLCFGNALSQTSIVHGIDQPSRSRLWRIFIVTGFLMMGLNVLLLSTDVYRWVFESIDALDPATTRITDHVMWLLTPWFFIYTVTGYYSGLLAKMHITRPGMTAALIKLGLITALFGWAITVDPITGVYVAALASVLGAVTVMLWIRRAYHIALPDPVD